MRFQLTPVVKNILIACIILFIGTTILVKKEIINLNYILGLHYPSHPDFNPYQLITHMFMHAPFQNGGITHLLFNMFGLVTFGVILEQILGAKKFIILYFFSGLGAILIHLAAQSVIIHQYTGNWFLTNSVIQDFLASKPSQDVYDIIAENYHSTMVGASGCLYGISAAFAFLFPNTALYIMFIPVPIKAKYVIPGFIALDLFLGVSNFNWDPVAHFAHVGGGVFGFALTYYWRKKDKRNFW